MRLDRTASALTSRVGGATDGGPRRRQACHSLGRRSSQSLCPVVHGVTCGDNASCSSTATMPRWLLSWRRVPHGTPTWPSWSGMCSLALQNISLSFSINIFWARLMLWLTLFLAFRWRSSANWRRTTTASQHHPPTSRTGRPHRGRGQVPHCCQRRTELTPHQRRRGAAGVSSFLQGDALEGDPSTEHGSALFVTNICRNGSGAQTAKVYLAGVRHLHLRRGASFGAFNGPRLAAAVQGFQRLGPGPRPFRPPVTLAQLRTFKASLTRVPLPQQDQWMLWAAVALAYFGVLRVSKYTCPGRQTSDKARTLTRRRVTLAGNRLTLNLGITKTDQASRGAQVSIGAITDELCQVAAVCAYLHHAQPSNADSPFFRYNDRRNLMPADANWCLQRFVGPNYSSHCLRIGGATREAQGGARSWEVQASGPWRSAAFRCYIRPANSSMVQLAWLMVDRQSAAAQ